MAAWLTGGGHKVLATLQNFSSGLAQRPEVFGVSRADADQAVRVVEALEQAMLVVIDPSTATAPAFAAKKEALAAATKHCTKLATFIHRNQGVSDADRWSLGLAPPAKKRSVGPPHTVPILYVSGSLPGGHTIVIRDSCKPDRRAKPKEASGLELVVAYSPCGGAELCGEQIIQRGQRQGILTRTTAIVIHPGERVGSVANYIGRWINNRGEAGPWSQPVRMTLAMPAEDKRQAA